MEPGRQRLLDQHAVGMGRCADIDQVEFLAGQQVAEARGTPGDAEFRCGCLGLVFVEVTDRLDLEPVRHLGIRLQMAFADAQPDHGDAQLFICWMLGHHRTPTRTAIAWAFKASSVARKQCACDIAVSVRFRTSWTRRGP